MIITESTEKDTREIRNLLISENLPVKDIRYGTITFWVLKNQQELVGVIGLETFNKFGLLRSLAVKKDFKNQGFGSKLIEHVIKHSSKQKIQTLYLLTTTAEQLFKKLGFKLVQRTDCPDSIKNTAEFKDICPESAITMVKDLSKRI
ncbi:arsenic resistance N-acetyltransferase ArsN2 [Flagellimonas profundi]|uniref:GNAT family N-acetyltransferase n=1 Tax=Flagellimonas profundi TaxID=2915620 RepID=A0ABS3FJV6_9FLAO|nr:arsenic resistance N-acetyltransferase ArsN2 [Allomuricauda profundi]MBO0343487.1 GNAT family N-acetyltransferase [Allomuricauda profundi]